MALGQTHLSFAIKRTGIRDRILIPKFYDPDLELSAELARSKYDLPLLGDVLQPGESGSRLGDWVRRDHYGSGDIPFVRTSDLAHWRIRPDFKKGVSHEIYDELRDRQDVRVDDLLFVAHGTYLIGTVALVRQEDLPLVLQDHVFRLRVRNGVAADPYYLLAALSTAFVRRQVRARQFSADIIDKIGDRHLSIRVPLARSSETRARISARVRALLDAQTETRKELKKLMGSDFRMTRERSPARLGFSVSRSRINDRLLIPKYYDPTLATDLADAQLKSPPHWLSLGELADAGFIELSGGVEVGKMAYGTGHIPFLRTSDLADLEVKLDSRHSVSDTIYHRYRAKASLGAGDILLVRDGTYLVGTTALVSATDLPALFCGGIVRIRVPANSPVNRHALLAALNLPLARRQMRARQFTRDVIDTLGQRLREIRIPEVRGDDAAVYGERIRLLMEKKAWVKRELASIVAMIEPPAPAILVGRPSWSMR